MKTLILSIVVALGTTAVAEITPFLSHHNFVTLMKDQGHVVVHISYPGKLSNICGVELKTSQMWVAEQSLRNLAKQIRVSEGFWGQADPTLDHKMKWDLKTTGFVYKSLEAKLPKALLNTQLYMTNVSLKTESGETLEELISDVLGDKNGESEPSAILVAVPCT